MTIYPVYTVLLYFNPKWIVYTFSERHRIRCVAGRGGEEHVQLLRSVPLVARHRHLRDRHPHPLLYITQVRLIQYNLDSTCPDSTFNRLVRCFLLEHISYFVTEINHLVYEIG